jgi:hypothetical protein
MVLRPLANKRPLGPFLTTDSDDITQPPDDIEPPKVTDAKGNGEYWKRWTETDKADGVPSNLLPVTGLYYPKENWVVIDDRIRIHHAVMEHYSTQEDTIPNTREHMNIPFAHDYIGTEYNENIVGLQGRPDVIEEVQNTSGWNSVVSIPEEGSQMYNISGNESITDVSSKSLYHIVYSLFSVGVEPESTVNMQVRGEGPIIHLDELYANLPMLGFKMVPEQKFERDNNIVKEEL